MNEPFRETQMGLPRKRSWWSRNWAWFIPAGCISALALLAGFVWLILSFVAGMMKSSDAYKQALARARANPAVVDALGQPIREGFFVSGSINVNGPSGHADLAIPIAGSRGQGTIFLVAHKAAGQWSYSTLVVEIDQTHQRFDLLKEWKE